MLDKAAVRETAIKFSDEVVKSFNPDKIILFGSYANGNPTEWSDIDIAVIMNNFNGEWYETSIKLIDITMNISLDIEPHLLDETKDPSGFVEHIVKTGEVLYSA